MKEIIVDAVIDQVPVVTEFLDGELEKMDCSMKAQIQIDVAIDEIFSNIAFYAYEGQEGKKDVRIGIEALKEGKGAAITFIDRGMHYDPLKKEDPDVTLSAEKRGIGGLGIFMVKKTMNEVIYEYKDGENRLTLIKKW